MYSVIAVEYIPYKPSEELHPWISFTFKCIHIYHNFNHETRYIWREHQNQNNSFI